MSAIEPSPRVLPALRVRKRGAGAEIRLSVLAAIFLVLAPLCGSAQQVYEYRGADGTRVYSDRRPQVGGSYEVLPLGKREQRPEVRLFRRSAPDGEVTLSARNPFYGPVQIAYTLTATGNLQSDAPRRGLAVLAPRSERQLLSLRSEDPALPVTLQYRFAYLLGDPQARHRPSRPYRLPFALASSFPVSQAFPDRVTHDDLSSQYAIDFAMPVGTGVYAARAGTVIEIAGDYHAAGLDPAVDGPRANFVRVLHDDGTMSLYAHLNWNSIRVVPGQHVARGEYLADSGNTGFSTGPHLHFVVQRNRGGAMVSEPVQFEGPGGAPVTVATGDRPVAY